MSQTFLSTILDSTRGRVAAARNSSGLTEVRGKAESIRAVTTPHSFRSALSRKDRINVIAEIKRASPSKGVINGDIDVSKTAQRYEQAGAAAISVLTESDYFKGSIHDLELARGAVDVPLLRKDFTVDEYQIYEAAASGADAVLLIAAALSPAQIAAFLEITEVELGLDAVVEVHTQPELEIAIACGARIIGVNNRDLHSFEVSLDVARDLIRSRPPKTLMIAESGISTADEIKELRSLGFDGFLIGETLMRSTDPGSILKAWI